MMRFLVIIYGTLAFLAFPRLLFYDSGEIRSLLAKLYHGSWFQQASSMDLLCSLSLLKPGQLH